MDYEKEEDNEEEYIPLNWDSLFKNKDVLEVIKEELDNLDAECLMKIITAAKQQGLKDLQIFKPLTPVVEVEYEDLTEGAFPDSTED
jgi:hypothetical protein